MSETIFEARIEIPNGKPFIAYRGTDAYAVYVAAHIIEWGAKQIPGAKAVIIDPTGNTVIHKMATEECDKRGVFRLEWDEIQEHMRIERQKAYGRFEFRRS